MTHHQQNKLFVLQYCKRSIIKSKEWLRWSPSWT